MAKTAQKDHFTEKGGQLLAQSRNFSENSPFPFYQRQENQENHFQNLPKKMAFLQKPF